jgi:peptide/nickel transport system substrate-binding protein
MNKLLCGIAALSILFFGCKSEGGKTKFKRGNKNEIFVHELADADMILPYNSTSADAMYLEQLAFQKLIDLDYETGEFTGIIAKSRPTITPITSGEFTGGMKIDYEIRQEAVWDNGTPITAHDVAFTFKTVLNPKTNNENVKPYYDWVGDFAIDPTNPKKFSIFSNQQYILIEEYSGYWVLPEYIYDAKQTMRKFTIKELNSSAKRTALKSNNDIQVFADDFNSERFQREKGYVVGSGPYEFTQWVTGQKIEFQRKKNWWGDKVLDSTSGFKAYPEKITHKIINDWSTIQTAIKSEDLDCVKGVEYKVFTEFGKNEKVKANYNLETPSSNQYLYIGLNQGNEKFKDLKVRQALAHAVNRSQIINTLLYGLAEPVESMVHPTKSYYNKNLKPFDFNLETSGKLLDEAGWKDSDGDGFRDKMLNGKLTKLSFDFKLNSGNETRKNIALIFKEDAKKIGVEINIIVKEWTVYLQELDKHDFEMYCGAWVGDPTPEDPKQIWHTESSNGGSNYVNYGDKQSDQMIDNIRKELNDDKRKEIYLRFQEKVHNDVPYIFLYAPKERIVMHKRFVTKAYTARPGYVLSQWKVAQ